MPYCGSLLERYLEEVANEDEQAALATAMEIATKACNEGANDYFKKIPESMASVRLAKAINGRSKKKEETKDDEKKPQESKEEKKHRRKEEKKKEKKKDKKEKKKVKKVKK